MQEEHIHHVCEVVCKVFQYSQDEVCNEAGIDLQRLFALIQIKVYYELRYSDWKLHTHFGNTAPSLTVLWVQKCKCECECGCPECSYLMFGHSLNFSMR